MALDLTDRDHNEIDEYLTKLLKAYMAGRISLSFARIDLAHVIAGTAKDNPAIMSHVRASLAELP